MSHTVSTEQIKKLVRLTVDDAADVIEKELANMKTIQSLVENDMNVHRALCGTIVQFNNVSLNQVPIGSFSHNPTFASSTFDSVLKAEDVFATEVLKQLKKQAMYYGSFSNLPYDFATHLTDGAKELMSYGPETLVYESQHNIGIYFTVLCMMMDLRDSETMIHEIGDVIYECSKDKNNRRSGEDLTPYKVRIKSKHHEFEENIFTINKDYYGMGIVYNCFGKDYPLSLSVSDTEKEKLTIGVPSVIMTTLAQIVSLEFKEFSPTVSVKDLVTNKASEITQILDELIKIATPKLKPYNSDYVLRDDEKIDAVVKGIRAHSYNSEQISVDRNWVVNNFLKSLEVNEEDKTEIIAKPEMKFYYGSGVTRKFGPVNVVFTNKEFDSIIQISDGMDDLGRFYLFWILTKIHNRLIEVRSVISESTVVGYYV